MAAELAWADAGEDVLVVEMAKAQRRMADRILTAPGALMGDQASAVDVGFLQRPETVEAFGRIIPEQAVNGVWGSVDDTLAFARAWGFDLAQIGVPVLITFGDDDTSCPVAHGRFLAAGVPGAKVIETRGGGHFAADPVQDILATHVWLVTGRLESP